MNIVDLVNSIPVDYMYCVLEGVAKWLLNIITEYAVFKRKRNLLYSYCLQYCTLRVHCSPRNLFKVHNEIHNIPKPCLVKYFKWLLKVIRGQRAGKGHILLLDQTTKGTLEAQRAQCRLVEA